MQDSNTTARQSKIRAGQNYRTKIACGVLTAFTAALLAFTGCTAAPAGTNTAGPSNTSTAGEETAAPTTKASPSPMVEAVYVPASADGPAQNVPVPVLPDKAKEFSKEGLIAFAEYWYSTLGYAFETGDAGPMMANTEADCKTCAFINEPISELYDAGGWIVGGTMTVHQSTTTFQQLADGTYQVILMIQQEKVSAFSSDKTLSNEHPQHKARANILVAHYTNNAWRAQTAEALTKD